MDRIRQFFEIEKNQTSLSTEIRAGLVTFSSMAYIIHVHPYILSQTGVSFTASVTTTVLVCFFSSLTMSLYAKNPLAMAPGLGINAFFTYTLVLQLNIPFEIALGATFWSGVLFLILSIFKIREVIINSVPDHLKKAIAGGIGLMIAFVGLRQGQWIVSSKETLVQMAPFSTENLLFIVGLLMTIFFVVKKYKGAFLISIILTTLLCIPFGRWVDAPLLVDYQGSMALPDFSLIGQIDFVRSLHVSFLPIIFSLAFVDLFESLGTLMSLLNRFHLTENQKPRKLKESLIADALCTVYCSLLGSSSGTTYVESVAGMQEGGRTGLTAFVVSILFLPFLFFSPLLSMIPAIATAPILVMVGVLMMEPIMHIRWKSLEIAIPSFIAFILIPLSFSITNGIIWGFLSYTFTTLCIGKNKSLTAGTWVISGICLISVMIQHSFL